MLSSMSSPRPALTGAFRNGSLLGKGDAMAKKRTGGSMMDKLPNRKYVTVTWAAASTTDVYTQFDTMMGARDGAGWLISRIDVGFGHNFPPTHGMNAGSIRFQLLTGAQVATLQPDDDEVIATIDLVAGGITSGLAYQQWPLTWVGPVLVASRELTCAMDASADISPYQTEAMLFTVWYNWVKLGAREWVEIAEARGIA